MFVGRDYNGIGSEYSEYVSRALAELRQAGALDLVAIPFFLSGADPILQGEKGLAHPVLTQWLETGIANTIAILAHPLAGAARGAKQNQETSK